MADKCWKTVITAEILTYGENPPEYDGLDDVAFDGKYGDASLVWHAESEEMTQDAFIEAVQAQGSDPTFFFGEDDD